MNKLDVNLPGIRVPRELATAFYEAKTQANEQLSEIGRELVQDFIRLVAARKRIARPARFVSDPSEMRCEVVRVDPDGAFILRCT